MANILIAVDVDTTGPNLQRHALVEIGAVAVIESTGAVVGKFLELIRVPNWREWDVRCVSEYWNSSYLLRSKQARLRDGEGADPETALIAFVNWLRSVGGDTVRRRIVSDNVGFDAKWIDYYLNAFCDLDITLATVFGSHLPVLCTSSYAQGFLRLTSDTVHNDIAAFGYFSEDRHAHQLRPLPDDAPVHDHDSRNDAHYIAVNHLNLLAHDGATGR